MELVQNKIKFIIIGAFVMFSCNLAHTQQVEDVKHKEINDTVISDNILNLKLYKKIVLKCNNLNYKSIGYKLYSDDESIGVKSIFPFNDYVYITDVFHTNIKRIEINTGEIISSKCLSPDPPDISGIWLRDIVLFNNKIYVTSDRDSIYVYSMDLSLLKTIPTDIGRKYIYKISEDSLEFFLSDNQLTDKRVETNLLLIDKNENGTKINTYTAIGEYAEKLKKSSINGNLYSTYEKDGKHFFKSRYGILEIKNQIPSIEKYGAFNINFNSSTLVYFDSSAEQLVLYIYKY